MDCRQLGHRWQRRCRSAHRCINVTRSRRVALWEGIALKWPTLLRPCVNSGDQLLLLIPFASLRPIWLIPVLAADDPEPFLVAAGHGLECLLATGMSARPDVGARRRCGRRRRERRRWHGRRDQLRPAHEPPAIANLDRARGIFGDDDRAPRGCLATLPLELQGAIVVPHHPVGADDPRSVTRKNVATEGADRVSVAIRRLMGTPDCAGMPRRRDADGPNRRFATAAEEAQQPAVRRWVR
jgi:hypothetical protein